MHENTSPRYGNPGSYYTLVSSDLLFLSSYLPVFLYFMSFNFVEFSQSDTVGGRENDGDRKEGGRDGGSEGGREKPQNLGTTDKNK